MSDSKKLKKDPSFYGKELCTLDRCFKDDFSKHSLLANFFNKVYLNQNVLLFENINVDYFVEKMNKDAEIGINMPTDICFQGEILHIELNTVQDSLKNGLFFLSNVDLSKLKIFHLHSISMTSSFLGLFVTDFLAKMTNLEVLSLMGFFLFKDEGLHPILMEVMRSLTHLKVFKSDNESLLNKEAIDQLKLINRRLTCDFLSDRKERDKMYTNHANQLRRIHQGKFNGYYNYDPRKFNVKQFQREIKLAKEKNLIFHGLRVSSCMQINSVLQIEQLMNTIEQFTIDFNIVNIETEFSKKDRKRFNEILFYNRVKRHGVISIPELFDQYFGEGEFFSILDNTVVKIINELPGFEFDIIFYDAFRDLDHLVIMSNLKNLGIKINKAELRTSYAISKEIATEEHKIHMQKLIVEYIDFLKELNVSSLIVSFPYYCEIDQIYSFLERLTLCSNLHELELYYEEPDDDKGTKQKLIKDLINKTHLFRYSCYDDDNDTFEGVNFSVSFNEREIPLYTLGTKSAAKNSNVSAST